MPQQKPARRLADREPPVANEIEGPHLFQTVTQPGVKPGDAVGHAVLVSLETALSRIQKIEPAARLGESEGIHRLRTTTRRLRSELRAFHDLVDPHWVEEIEGELKWLAGLLGDVRDVDVLSERLRKALCERDDPDRAAMSPLFDELTARHTRASQALRNALQSDRYRDLLASVQRAIEQPALKDDAWVPCRAALPPLAESAWRRLKKSARGLRPTDPDDPFHKVRKLAKRARYTAEMIAPILGRSAAKGIRQFIRAVIRVQDTLGEHQDARVADQEITAMLAARAEDAAFGRVARQLLEIQNDAAQAARRRFFQAWDKLDRKKLRRWMKTESKVKS
jgi:CHAD domain-containing protein